MPGPRKDKERAWGALEWWLYEQGVRLVGIDRWPEDEDVSHALGILRDSGRLDARQVFAIKKVLEAVVRADRRHRRKG